MPFFRKIHKRKDDKNTDESLHFHGQKLRHRIGIRQDRYLGVRELLSNGLVFAKLLDEIYNLECVWHEQQYFGL